MKLRSLSAAALTLLLVLAVIVPAIANSLDARYVDSGPGGDVRGTLDPESVPIASATFDTYPTEVFNIRTRDGDGNTTDVQGWCVDINNLLNTNSNFPYRSVGWQGINGIGPVTHILDDYLPGDADENRAIQAAIWHFTDGFRLDPNSDVFTRYQEILADADGRTLPDTDFNLQIAGPTDPVFTQQRSGPFTVTSDRDGPVTLSVPSGASLWDTAADGAQVAQVTVAGGSSETFWVESGTAGDVIITATGTATFPSGLVFVAGANDQRLIMANDVEADGDATATASFIAADPDISLDKTVTPTNVTYQRSVGGNVQLDYSFVITNTGNEPLEGLTLVDEFTTLQRDGSNVTVDLTSDLAATTLDVGSSTTVTASFTLTQAEVLAFLDSEGSLDNDATVTATGSVSTQGVWDYDDASVTFTEIWAPGISLEKSVTPTELSYQRSSGEDVELIYTFLITNTGDEPLGNLQLIDTFDNLVDSGDTPISVDLSDQLAGIVLAPGATTTVTTTFTVTTDQIGQQLLPDPSSDGGDVRDGVLRNTATVDGVGQNSQEPVRDDDRATVTFTEVWDPQIQLLKEAIGASGAGVTATISEDGLLNAITLASTANTAEVEYRFTITNTGDEPISSIVFDDDRLATETIATINSALAGLTLDPASSTVVTATMTTTSADLSAGMVVNVADVDGTGDYSETPVSDDDTVEVPIRRLPPPPPPGQPGIDIIKVANPTSIELGEGPDATDVVTYTYTVFNTGSTTLNNVTLVDDVLGDLTTQLRDAIGGSTLAAGTSVSFSVTQTVGVDDVGTLVNVATVEGVAPGGAVVDADDDAEVEITQVLGEIVEEPEETPEETPEPEDTTEVPEEEESEVLDEIVEQDDVTEASEQQVLSRTGVDLVLLTPLGLLLAVLGLAVLRLTTRRRSDVVR